MAISYQGSFDLTNTMVPHGVQHSFVYHVQWVYSWAGTWGELFAGKTFSNQTSFQKFGSRGSMRATWRESPGGPQLTCTLRIVPAMDDFANFGARTTRRAGRLKLVGLPVGRRRLRPLRRKLRPDVRRRARHRHVQRAARAGTRSARRP